MKKQWDDFTEKLKDFRSPLEDMMQELPLSKKYYRMKVKIEKQWKELSRAFEKVDVFINDTIESVPVDSPWASDDFKKTWHRYKEYLKEQHGVIMKSRMEIARLEWLKKNTEDNPELAITWMKYWMARGSEAIYKVNIDTNKEQDDEQIPKRAGFSLPTA